MRQRWSPDQIAGRSRRDFPQDRRRQVGTGVAAGADELLEDGGERGFSIAAAPPLRALDAFVDRCLAADEALARAAEATAAAHVLRVYAQLAESEQRMVDDLLRGGSLDEVLATVVRRTEDEALELLRRRIGTVEPVVSAASLARQIGGVRDQLTDEEYDRVIMRLPHLSADEQQALHSHLRAMTPDDAAMLLRSNLRPVRH